MASEIRVDKITSLSGVGTITPSPTGIEISGITTVATLKATTGIVTTLTATTGIVTTLTANTVTSLGDVDIADKIIHTGDTNTAIRFPAADTITAETGGAEALRVTSSTAVIVAGTSAYSDGTFGEAKLQFNTKTGNHIGACSVADSNNSITHVLFKNPTGAIASVGTHNSDFIALTGNTERLRISSTGQLSVATTADVTGANVAIAGSMRLVNATGQSSTITALPSGTYNTGVSGGSAIVFHRFSDAGGGSDEIAFETHHQGTRHGEAARFNKSGNLVFPSGQGIDFTATGDGGTVGSELFDDYEEGAFTPTSNATLTTAAGFYTKKGREVTLHIRVTVAGSQSSSTPFEISGFPFTSGMSGTTSNGAVPSGFGYISSGSVIPQIHHIHNDTKTQFYNFNAFMSIANVSGKEYRLGLIYYST